MNDLTDLATRVGQTLQTRNWFLATAESCTGGGISHAVTDIPGSSEWFDCGFVTYSNDAKAEQLGVSPALIAQHGAVSEEIAIEMARGAVANSNATVAVSATGIAGPGGAVPGKPVGTVCFAWVIGDKVQSERRVFSGDRRTVREQAVAHALQGLLRRIESA